MALMLHELEILWHLDEIENNQPQRDLRRQRVMRDRCAAFEMLSDYKFKRLFRLSKDSINALCDTLRHRLEGNHALALPVDVKVLVAIRFFAVGCYQLSVGQDLFLTVSQPSVSRCVSKVSLAIIELCMADHIKFPSTEEEELQIKTGFCKIGGIPGVIGAIDGTHIAIVAPSQQNEQFREQQYVNRKGFYSINAQIICDHTYRILNMNAKFPGSAHDSHIFRMSQVSAYLERAYIRERKHSWLIGDSGYPLRPWLMTPILDAPAGSAEERYTTAFTKTRQIVECTIGILKQVFRCLLGHRTLHYDPTAAGRIIYACCVLHNLRRDATHVPADDEFSDSDDEGDDEVIRNRRRARQHVDVPPYVPQRNDNFLRAGERVREQIVRRFRR